MNDRMRKGCCRLLTLLLTLVLVIPAYGQETLDALAAAQGCTAETLLQSDKLTAGDSVSDWVAIAVSREIGPVRRGIPPLTARHWSAM